MAYRKFSKRIRKTYTNKKVINVGLSASFLGRQVFRKINGFIPVYAVKNTQIGALGSYTFSSDINQIAPTLSFNLIRGMMALSNEFIEMRNSYANFKIIGVNLNFKRSIVDSSISSTNGFISYPALHFDVVPSIVVAINKNTAYLSDTSMGVQLFQSSAKGKSKYYSMPDVLYGLSGLPFAGKDVWFPTIQYSQSTVVQLNVLLGYPGDFSALGDVASYIIQVGILEAEIYCVFAKPIIVN